MAKKISFSLNLSRVGLSGFYLNWLKNLEQDQFAR